MIDRPPLWKIKRELARIGRQLRGSWGTFYSYYFGALDYDFRHRKDVKTFQGELTFKPKVAVYVVYPKSGLLESHQKSLEYIISQGYSPVIVSNLPFSPADKKELLSKCWVYVERPNIGYDFGAYREGILFLRDKFPEMERLALLNDSSWFPVGNSHNWIKDAEALNVDYAGAATNFGTPRAKTESLLTGEWTYSYKHRNFHYCSFAILIGPRILKSSGFARFWKYFPLTSEKNRTVRRGEIGLSQWVIRNGFAHEATLKSAELNTLLSELSHERLHEIAMNLMTPDNPKVAKVVTSVLAQESIDKDTLVRLILTCVGRVGASYCFPNFAINEGRFPFLKKSPLRLDAESSATSLTLIQNLPDAQKEYIYPEALELAKDLPDKDEPQAARHGT